MKTIGQTLTIGSFHGLANRLRPLLSGLTIAEASGRHFTMLWPRTPECAAGFHDLFVNPWPVQEVEPVVVESLPPCPSLPDILTMTEPHLTLRTPHWLLVPECYPHHATLIPRCNQLLADLKPVPHIAEQTAVFRAERFRPRMIGVHLRRGDFTIERRWMADNLANSFRAVDQLSRRWPDAGILLCSDDGAVDPHHRPLVAVGVLDSYRRRYGDRLIVRSPASLDRTTVAGVQDALIDLLLLRSTDALMVTYGSSFSAVAVFGKPAPVLWAAPDDWRYEALESILAIPMLARMLQQDSCRRFGRQLALPEAIQYYARRLARRFRNRKASHDSPH